MVGYLALTAIAGLRLMRATRCPIEELYGRAALVAVQIELVAIE